MDDRNNEVGTSKSKTFIKGVAIGAASMLLVSSLSQSGINIRMHENIVKNTNEDLNKPNAIVEEGSHDSIVETENNERFVVPESITWEGHPALRVPKGYQLYKMSSSKTDGMLGVASLNDCVIYYGVKNPEDFVGIQSDLKFILNGAEGLIRKLKGGDLDALNAVRPNAISGGLLVPSNYILYRLPKDMESFGVILDSDSRVPREDGDVYALPEGSSIEDYVALHSYMGQMLYGIDSIKNEMEEFCNGHISKTIN